MEQELLTTRDLAARYDISIKTAAYWCRSGYFPNAFQVNIQSGRGRAWLIPKSDLDEFAKPGKPGVGRPRAPKPEKDPPSENADAN